MIPLSRFSRGISRERREFCRPGVWKTHDQHLFLALGLYRGVYISNTEYTFMPYQCTHDSTSKLPGGLHVYSAHACMQYNYNQQHQLFTHTQISRHVSERALHAYMGHTGLVYKAAYV